MLICGLFPFSLLNSLRYVTPRQLEILNLTTRHQPMKEAAGSGHQAAGEVVASGVAD